ncbi:MAG: PorP/SprF family type IX secretion system membrane protein [Flavobacteriales bacterium]|nr:PorP/SprF family type IX secretion system membrane protein [Flavobacteriales bacterium]
MVKTLLFLLLLMVTAIVCRAQDAHFTQYLSTPIYLNPAFAGYDGCTRFAASYRNQWPNEDGNYQTVNASFDQFVRPFRGGVAVNFQYDNSAGTLKKYMLSTTYSPVFRLFNEKLVLSPAFEMGWRRSTIDWSKLTFGDMIDPRYGYVYNTQIIPQNDTRDIIDMQVGLLMTQNLFRNLHHLVYGVAFHHVTQPDVGFSGTSVLWLKTTAHITYVGRITKYLSISPTFIYMKQQDFEMFLPSLAFELWKVRLGAGFRASLSNFDSVNFMAGYSIGRFSLGYSYDHTVSSLRNQTGGSHEAHVAVRFNCKNKEQWRKGVALIGF